MRIALVLVLKFKIVVGFSVSFDFSRQICGNFWRTLCSVCINLPVFID